MFASGSFLTAATLGWENKKKCQPCCGSPAEGHSYTYPTNLLLCIVFHCSHFSVLRVTHPLLSECIIWVWSFSMWCVHTHLCSVRISTLSGMAITLESHMKSSQQSKGAHGCCWHTPAVKLLKATGTSELFFSSLIEHVGFKSYLLDV